MSRRLDAGLAALAAGCGLVALTLMGGCMGEVQPTGQQGVDGGVSAADAAPRSADAAPVAVDAAPGAADAAPGAIDAAPTGVTETLTVQFDTTANGGPYAPRNIVAVWVTDSNGAFVKTLGRWANTRVDHLVAWGQASPNDQDAISGATRAAHTARLSVTWDMKSKAGQAMPDGTYTIRMELADSNASQPAQNRQGTFTFVKNGTAATQTVASGGFVNVAISYSGR
ncbi:MAG: DUF2271 domain-containing protein [Deltaproteobacteria bacterium]|nr:DUF2271 domain-containing protein [Deltaproteobacteria bacterium]